MVKGFVDNVLIVFCFLDVLLEGYDIYINFLGGILIDGFFVGIVMVIGVYFVVYCIYVNNEVVMIGEISIYGEVKFIGGVYVKIKVVKKVGVKKVIIFVENM